VLNPAYFPYVTGDYAQKDNILAFLTLISGMSGIVQPRLFPLWSEECSTVNITVPRGEKGAETGIKTILNLTFPTGF